MASSSSTSHSKWSYDVFLSFRGEDTRRNFTDHLYKALIHSGFRTFRDDEEIRRGEEIAQELLTAIEESRSAIIVFSKTYAHSKWCLEELVKIMKCKEEREQMVVIPIFYHVDPSEVRNQTGIYGEAFTHHEESADEERKEKIRKWKTALRQASNLAGYDATNRYESELIDEIIENVSRSFPKTLDVNENIVGMDSRLERLISLLKIELNDVRMVGVYGLGGIGKTTIINALYNQISNQFKSVSLLTDVRKESTENSGLLKLQQQLLNDTLRTTKKIVLRNVHEGIKEIRDKLSSKKVLVFLDDVDELTQLEHLIGKHNWFGPGSRIIITTRKKDLLTRHEVNDMYEVEKLNFHEALQLFCRYAFKQHHPKVGYGDLSHQVVRYADGLPLALKVLGSLLFGKRLPDWKSELRNLEKVPNMEIVKVLKISFDGLDYTQRMIFLDIACFFKGYDVKLVSRVLDGSGLEAESGINALVDRCFITISKDNIIDMHDLLAQMGKGIVHEECPNEPGERSRLWRHTDIYRVLKRNTIQFTSEAFERMHRLRLLFVFHNRIQLSEDFVFPSDDLTCLRWDRYSLESLPSNFHANNLVSLGLRNSNIKLLWKGNMCLRNLRYIDLSDSQQLIELPNFSNMPYLEELILSGCVSLESLPGDIHQSKLLLILDCSGCSKLTNETAIKELPSSIELLEGLRNLYLDNFLSLEGRSKLDRLRRTGENAMSRVSFLKFSRLSIAFFVVYLLRELYLDQCNLTPGVIKSDNRVFHCIFHLSSPEVLNLSRCNPEEGGTLGHTCGYHQLSNLRALDLNMHTRGTSLPPMHSPVNCLKSANRYDFLDLKHQSNSNGVFLADSHYIGHGICIVVQGSSGIPKWIRNQQEGRQIRMDLPQNCYENNDFLGIAICCVYAPLPENDFADTSKNESGDEALDEYDDLLEAESSISTELQCQFFRTTCKCYHDGGVSEQMWVIFYPKAAILESCHTNPFMFLTSLFKDSRNHFKVLKCGLQPIYSQDPIVQTEDMDASCLECQRNVEHRKLCLKGQTISLLPIERASEFDTLCLRECKNLESLPTSIWEFKSLKSLFCSYCSQLLYFPEILENMENLRQLHLNGTAIKELPSSIEHLNRLKVLNLDRCQNLVTLPESICNLCFLEVLDVSYCSKLHKLPQNLGRLQSLKHLRACGLNSTCCQLLSLSGLCSLKMLILYGSKLMQGVILSDICCLYSLEMLDLSFCNIDEGGIPTEICHLSSLQELLLTGNLFRSIPAGINQLSMLRLLDLGHCQELRQIPALPYSLRVLDVHECTRLETCSGLLWSSLFNCFKSVIQDLECKISPREKRFTRVNLIISVSCGMPKWISHHKKGATVVAKLPQNWYKNDDLLGFVLYCVYDPLDNESEETLENDATYFQYGLTLRDHEIQFVDELQFYPSYHCYDVVPKMWMTYYPKVEIVKNSPSNKWRQLTASFSMIPTICRECQEDVQSRRKLCLKGNAINELPTIECPLERDSLCLRECKNLERLPSSICELKSLTTLFCSGCLRLRSFPEIIEDVENLRELHLDGTAIEELPTSIQYLRGLQYLNLAECTNLVSLPESICNLSSLKILNVSFCTKLEKFPENLRSLQCLEGLHASGLNLSMDCFSSILAGIIQLSKLRVLELSHCQGLLQVPELPPSLRVLDVHSCTCLESLSSPSSLLGVSLFKCFKSTIEDLKHKKSSNGVFLANSNYIADGVCIVVPGSNGIPKWIRNQREGYDITIELPQNCYENDDFLGIAICFVYAPLDECENDFAHASENESGDEALNESDDLLEAESSISTELKCQLSLYEVHGFSFLRLRHLSFRTTCKCYHDGGVSEQMWVIFYPKAAILESCHTNRFMHLNAVFMGSRNHFKVLKCGLQPIYSQDPIVQTEDVDASCLECQRNVEHRKLCLKGQTISLLPIERASEFDTLCLRECKNLESLPTSIWEFKSLKSLFCSHCSQLQYFPEILENMENLRVLHLNKTAIKELPSSIKHLNRLEVLNLDGCKNLVTLPESICDLCFLEVLDVGYCSKLHKLPQNLGRLQSLKILYARGLNSTCCQLLSLSGLCSLKKLILYGSKLMQGVILSDICCLYSLEVLDLSFCNIDEGGIPTEICHLSSLQQLLLTENLFRSIPAGVNQLSMLRLLDLGHCQELRQIPALPSSLRVLDVHECTRLETSSGLLWSSLFNCFKSVIQDLECKIYAREKRFARVNLIISVSCGMPKWISHHKKGATVVAKLPQNWYKNNDLLGFVLYCVYDPLDNESEETLENDETYFQYGLTLRGHEIQFVDELQFYPSCHCYDVVPKMWMTYYPKVEIVKNSPSNKWGQLTASFYCTNLVSLPESICNLSSLKILNVSFCTKLEKFPENLRSLQCLEGLHASGLNLSMDCFSSILAGIIQLSKLRVLELSHCQGLLQVPELPRSLRYLEVHSCTCLETLSSPSSQLGFSLFKCFKSMIEEFECGSYWNKLIRVAISGNNGIPEWISQQKKGSQITIELPMDWYRNNDFLGFALYSVFIPIACDGLNCELNICGDQSECCHVDDVRFYCCPICHESSQMCVTYYPKVAIDNQYWSNEWRRLKASFHSLDAPVEVKECGYYLIYTGDVINRNIPEDTSTDAQRSCDNTEATKRDHQAMIEYNDEQRSCDTRSAAEDTNSNTQTSYDCTQCTECSDSPMDTTTQNINSNVVDAQDDEEDQMHNWLELLCKFVGWICCRRY
ncbi:hypothetical protein AAG906_000500 [Vitis piasezkii]